MLLSSRSSSSSSSSLPAPRWTRRTISTTTRARRSWERSRSRPPARRRRRRRSPARSRCCTRSGTTRRKRRSRPWPPPIPSCAMAHWGVAMSLYHPIWAAPTPAEIARGQAAVEKAIAAGAQHRPREGLRGRHRVLLQGRGDGRSPRRARSRYEKAMERVHQQYPDDREAAIFYSLALLGNGAPRRQDLREPEKGRRDPEPRPAAAARPPGRGPLPDPQLRLPAAGVARPARRPQLLEDRGVVAPRAAHAVAHLRAPGALGRLDPRQRGLGRRRARPRRRRPLPARARSTSCTPSTTSPTRSCSRGATTRRGRSWTGRARSRRSTTRSSRPRTRWPRCPRDTRWSGAAGRTPPPSRSPRPGSPGRSSPSRRRSPSTRAPSAPPAAATSPAPARRWPAWRRCTRRPSTRRSRTGRTRSRSSAARRRRGWPWPRGARTRRSRS